MKTMLVNNLGHIAIFTGILITTFLVAFFVNRFFKRLINQSTTIIKNDPTNYLFLRHMLNGIIYVVGISIAIYMMPNLRVLAKSLLAGAGVLAVAVGFAAQHSLSNIISGIFIVVFKPFRINDRLRVGDKFGTVEDITLRHTVLKDFENQRIIIPNSLISDEVIINSDIGDDRICKIIEVGISYSSNIEKAKSIIREEIMNHPLHIDHRTPLQIEEGVELVPVYVINLSDFAVILRGWAWAKDFTDARIMAFELIEKIKFKFDQEDIEIPFPHRTLIHKNSITQDGK